MMEEYDVVVVGAGPAGLTAALALARTGADVLLVERRPAGAELPRATVLSLRTTELLRRWGLEDEIRGGADDVEMTMLEMPTAARAAEGVRIDVGFPTAAQSAVISPTEALCVAQDHLEHVLARHVCSQGSATIERGTELVDLSAGVDGATLTVRDATSRVRTLSARYVVGADGARSRVRAALGIAMAGSDALLSGVRVEFRAPLWSVVGSHRHLLYVTTEPEPAVLLPAGQGDRWLYGLQVEVGDDVPSNVDAAALVDRIRRAAGVPELDVRVERIGVFSSGAFLAERFSDGPVFLVGDAAHRVTPRGGTGLNLAIADGFDLGWKLGWILRGWAGESLLATYEAERRPPVAHNVERSADPLGSRRHAAVELAVDLGGRIPHVWVDPLRRSTLDMIGDGVTLFVGDEAPAWREAAAAAAGPLPVSVVPLTLLTARSLGVSQTGALLVRPDGVPIAHWWTARDAALRLRAALADLLVGGPSAVAGPRTAA